MSYTRRSVLRNAAAISMGGIVCSSSLLTGCDTCPPTAFNSGVRIFFAGAWVFCADKQAGFMRAVTVDPGASAMPGVAPDPMTLKHTFPYGPWNFYGGWDASNPMLNGTKCADISGSDLKPHSMSVANFSGGAATVDDLFKQANKTSRFTYLLNPKSNSLKWNTPGILVITLPIPTRIIPTAFRVGASIVDHDSVCEKPHHNKDSGGVATTHIFEYEGAQALTFAPADSQAPMTMKAGTDYSSDFHVHTIPTGTLVPCGHDMNMFKMLVGLVNSPDNGGLALQLPSPDNNVLSIGALVPRSVGETELEMVSDHKRVDVRCNHLIDLASCLSGSMGVGGHG